MRAKVQYPLLITVSKKEAKKRFLEQRVREEMKVLFLRGQQTSKDTRASCTEKQSDRSLWS